MDIMRINCKQSVDVHCRRERQGAPLDQKDVPLTLSTFAIDAIGQPNLSGAPANFDDMRFELTNTKERVPSSAIHSW